MLLLDLSRHRHPNVTLVVLTGYDNPAPSPGHKRFLVLDQESVVAALEPVSWLRASSFGVETGTSSSELDTGSDLTLLGGKGVQVISNWFQERCDCGRVLQ